jgi:ATPase family associated with various cellular activities (AAA)
MTYFLRRGSTWQVSDKAALDIHERLPAGNYTIGADQFGNLFLEEIDSFELPSKLYGDATRNADRIVRTYLDRPASTGVLLNGEKGSGKTLLSKAISIKLAAEQGAPTLVINRAWHGDAFNRLIQNIEQPCVVLFDEFEKTYDAEQQQSILTLMDGVFTTKKLFILTVNDKWRVDSHMRNRPGRIFYMMDYKGLDVDFIREYCQDRLDDKSHIETICKLSLLYSAFNFDMLKALVEEMNRYGETPQDALKMLNAKPEYGESSNFDVKLIYKGQQLRADEHWNGNPLLQQVRIDYVKGQDDDGDDNWDTITVSPAEIERVDATNGSFTFRFADGMVHLTRQRAKDYGYYNLL